MDAISTEQPEPFPFMNLPTEIRLVIYSFALQDILSPPAIAHSRVPRPSCRGTLALLLTNKLIRAESAGEMHPILKSEHERLSADARRLLQELHSEYSVGRISWSSCGASWITSVIESGFWQVKQALVATQT